MVRLSSGDVCDVAGIDRKQLERWLEAGVLDPANNRRGHGHHLRYSIVEVTAAAYGAILRRLGFPLDWVGEAVRFVANQSVERLEKEFAAGRIIVLAFPRQLRPCELVAPVLSADATREQSLAITDLDLSQCLRGVKRKVAELSPRVQSNGTGRKRGLASCK